MPRNGTRRHKLYKKDQDGEIFYNTELGISDGRFYSKGDNNNNNNNNNNNMSEAQALKMTIDHLIQERKKFSITTDILQEYLKQIKN